MAATRSNRQRFKTWITAKEGAKASCKFEAPSGEVASSNSRAGLARTPLRDHLVDQMFGPPVTLCSVSRDAHGLLSLSVAIGRDPERTYLAWADADQRSASLDDQLFFELSELSLQRYADCTRYHMELCFLLTSIARGETVELPAVLGATRFARPPSRLRWIRNHILRLLRR